MASSYHAAHPKVAFQIDPIQNEQFTTKIPLALQSGSPPDIYQQWGGGQEATQVKSGKVMNITKDVAPLDRPAGLRRGGLAGQRPAVRRPL